MKIGYARVSTFDQTLDLQTDALNQAGCEKLFTDHGVSGLKAERPGLDQALGQLRKGDTLVIWKLDRLGRSLSHLLEVIEELKAKGVQFASVQDGFDTSTASGKMVFSVIGAMAEYERNLIKERTMAGLAAARARGRLGGRPKQLKDDQVKVAISLAEAGELTIREICAQVGCSRSTYYRQVAPLLKKEAVPTLTIDQSEYVPPQQKKKKQKAKTGKKKQKKTRPSSTLKYVLKDAKNATTLNRKVHAISTVEPQSGRWYAPALCGEQPKAGSWGWRTCDASELSCPKCYDKVKLLT
ncbi:MAG: recombinase family protein [Phormidesmis sp.]